jgi:hypothetical protein
MATTKPAFDENPPVESGAVVTIVNGVPTPYEVFVTRSGTVQFVNHDPVDYRLRLSTRDRSQHPDVDLLLSGRCGVTVIVDQDLLGRGQCYYDLFPIEITYLSWITETSVARETTYAGGEPEHRPRQPEFKDRKGPGGGIITVP